MRVLPVVLCLVLLVTSTVAVQADPDGASAAHTAGDAPADGRAHEDEHGEDGEAHADDDAPRTVGASEVPAFAAFRAPPTKIRLHAQFADDDAYLTLLDGLLPGSVTPGYDTRQHAQVAFEAFAPLTTHSDPDGRTSYGASAVHAGWATGFVPDVPVEAEWRLGIAPPDGIDVSARPLLVLDTALVAIGPEGDTRPLVADRTQVEPRIERGSVIGVPVTLGAPDEGIRPGDRLVVTLDWHWSDESHIVARPPSVTVHPGSWVDLPVEETLRIEEVLERRVVDGLYVRARLAHLFSAANIDISGTNVIMTGPGGNTVGGKPLRQIDPAEHTGGRQAAVDWRMPVPIDNMVGGAYDLYVATQQRGEEAPRLIVHRPIQVTGAAPVLEDPAEHPWLLGLGAFALLLSMAVPAYLVTRRIAAQKPRRRHIRRMPGPRQIDKAYA